MFIWEAQNRNYCNGQGWAETKTRSWGSNPDLPDGYQASSYLNVTVVSQNIYVSRNLESGTEARQLTQALLYGI